MDDAIDLLAYGATPAGIAAAVRAGREGLDVRLVTIRDHVGGMMAGGLSYTDSRVDGPRAPITDEFFERVRDHYRETYGPDSVQYAACHDGWHFEPHVAEEIFESMLEEAGVAVERGYEPVGVERGGDQLQRVRFERIDGDDRLAVAADAFVDGTYEGDLFAAAGCDYRVGRESREEFGEQYAGRLYSEKGTRLYSGSTGEGDDAVQAYDYRLCLTKDPDNRRPIPKPDGYDRTEFLPVIEDPPEGDDPGPARESEPIECRIKSELVVQTVADMRDLGLEALFLRGPLPNEKRDLNTADLPGGADAYPEGDWATRREIEQRHRDHVLGMLYFLQNDDAVPEDLQELWGEWGLPLDEFEDTDNFPFQIYVREGRRLVGRATFTEHDAREARGLGRAPVHADAIAITEYPMDSHDCRPIRRPGSLNDGHFFIPEITVPGQLSYDCLLPPDVDNLVVPTACSATHVGYGTVRLEPTWLQIGESAGWAAALAAERNVSPAALDPATLQRELAAAGSRLAYFADAEPGSDEWDAAVQFCGTKGFFDEYDAHPAAPLDRATASVWAGAAVDVLAGTVDAGDIARSLPDADADPVPAEAFVGAIEHECAHRGLSVDGGAALDAVGVAPADELSRGDACRLVFTLSAGVA